MKQLDIRENRYCRQSGLIKMDMLSTPITVIGCGAVGSFTTLALAKVGFHNLTVWDGDVIEEHNIPNQFYPLSAVGKSKTEALVKMVKMFEGVKIKGINRFWTGAELRGVIISAVDSMKVRSAIWKGVSRNIGIPVFIDGRMGGNQLEIYTVDVRNMEDRKRYMKTLYPDSATAPVPCTERAVMYNVLNMASWVVNQLRLVLSGKEYKRQMIMDLENMMLVIPEDVGNED